MYNYVFSSSYNEGPYYRYVGHGLGALDSNVVIELVEISLLDLLEEELLTWYRLMLVS